MEVLKRPILLLEGTKVVLERHPCFLEESYQGFGSAFFFADPDPGKNFHADPDPDPDPDPGGIRGREWW